MVLLLMDCDGKIVRQYRRGEPADLILPGGHNDLGHVNMAITVWHKRCRLAASRPGACRNRVGTISTKFGR
jgi:hypothetical protein